MTWLSNDLAPKRWQSIISTNDDHVLRRLMGMLGHSKIAITLAVQPNIYQPNARYFLVKFL